MAVAACHLALFLVLLGAATTTQQYISGLPFKTYNYNLKGSTLVLDVNSLDANWVPSHGGPPNINSVFSCEAACSRVPGCTGYTYCGATSCGSGCKAYAAANRKPAYPNWAAGIAKRQLPYTFFGPYGPTKACVGDKWPSLLCTLKVATPLSPPQFWTKDAAEGWISGVVAGQPAACKGLAAATCGACKASKSPAACYKCALKASTPAARIKAVFTTYGATWADGCVACAALPAAAQAACAGCLARDAPCGQCAFDKVDTREIYTGMDLQTCLTCSAKYPKAYARCRDCAGLKTAAARAKCAK